MVRTNQVRRTPRSRGENRVTRGRGLRGRQAWIMVACMLFVTTIFMAGCLGKTHAEQPDTPKVDPTAPADVKVKLTLYFADSQAQYLKPEVREVAKGNAPLPDLVVQELIKGPTTPGLGITMPKEARLVSSVKVENKTAFVNFNKEFQTKHWGGSTGELMTVYSIVNSLTELQDIDSVVFLIEGKRMDSLAGHMDLTGPVERNEDLIAK